MRKQKLKHDVRAQDRLFQQGDLVWVKNYGSRQPWLASLVKSTAGPVNFTVKLEDGKTHRCHADQLRHCHQSTRQSPQTYGADDSPSEVPDIALPLTMDPLSVLPGQVESTLPEPPVHTSPEVASTPQHVATPARATAATTGSPQTTQVKAPKVYPSRNRQCPDRYRPEL